MYPRFGLLLSPVLAHPGRVLAVAGAWVVLGFGIYQPAVYSFVTNAASERTRGMVLSFFLGAFDLGMSAGGLAAGGLVAIAGIPAMLRIMAIVPVIAALMIPSLLVLLRPDG